jgi:hypothetical protein
MDFQTYMQRYLSRIQLLCELFGTEELTLHYDRLSAQDEVDHEQLYLTDGKEERIGAFIFGFQFFLAEQGEQEFKRLLGLNSLNFRILHAYKQLKQHQRKVKVTDIVNHLQNRQKDSGEVHQLIQRILTLAYYLNWRLERDKKDLEGDYIITINDRFLQQLTMRYNFDVLASVYENETFFCFVNARGKLNVVFKEKESFTKDDIETMVLPKLEDIFGIERIVTKP